METNLDTCEVFDRGQLGLHGLTDGPARVGFHGRPLDGERLVANTRVRNGERAGRLTTNYVANVDLGRRGC